MKTLHVELGKNSYDIVIGKGLSERLSDYARSRGGRVMVLSDTNVAPLYARRIIDSLQSAGMRCDLTVLPAGEQTKRFDVLKEVYERLIAFKITRSDLIVTLGGGVIGDLGGFAAATFLRGVDFVQVPTSLLAQVDSSVGGKVAVDLPEGKNLIGSFYQPKAVVIDTDLIQTLSDRFFRDGMAEVIKYGCIADAELFALLEECRGREDVTDRIDEIVYTCCKIKKEIVERDERDCGERMLLNYGHTYGHALEKFYDYRGLSHGEAIAVGMSKVNEIAERNSLTPEGTNARVCALLQKFGLPTDDTAPSARVVEAIANDKKNMGEKLSVVLLHAIGRGYLYQTTGGFFKQ